jgi:hypothetical protein
VLSPEGVELFSWASPFGESYAGPPSFPPDGFLSRLHSGPAAVDIDVPLTLPRTRLVPQSASLRRRSLSATSSHEEGYLVYPRSQSDTRRQMDQMRMWVGRSLLRVGRDER